MKFVGFIMPMSAPENCNLDAVKKYKSWTKRMLYYSNNASIPHEDISSFRIGPAMQPNPRKNTLQNQPELLKNSSKRVILLPSNQEFIDTVTHLASNNNYDTLTLVDPENTIATLQPNNAQEINGIQKIKKNIPKLCATQRSDNGEDNFIVKKEQAQYYEKYYSIQHSDFNKLWSKCLKDKEWCDKSTPLQVKRDIMKLYARRMNLLSNKNRGRHFRNRDESV